METNELKTPTTAQTDVEWMEFGIGRHYMPYKEEREQCLRSAVKFEENGKWGLKSVSREIILEPKFEQIEFCADYIYARYNNRYRKQFYLGGSEEGRIDEDDYQFYENGKIGLKRADGSIFLPAIYDEIIDWGKRCDVVYVRQGNEYHYYNHQHEEILTEVEDIAEDAYPTCPYNLGEDQARGVLLCVEPIEKAEGKRDCFAYNQWVRLSRIRYADSRKLFAKCKVVPMAKKAIEHFNDKFTYIYSARTCTAQGEHPLMQCIEKLESLDCYESSWYYLLKFSINKHTKLNPHDLYNVIKFFEDAEGCIDYHIAIDYDNSLADDEVRLMQIHYYHEDGSALFWPENQYVLQTNTVEKIQKELDKFSIKKRKRELASAFWWFGDLEISNWKEGKRVLEYLKSEGCNDFNTLIHRSVDINFYNMDLILSPKWRYGRKIISWSVANGGQLNYIRGGNTPYDELLRNINDADKLTSDRVKTAKFMRSVERAKEFAEWLRGIGSLTAEEQRKKIEPQLEGLTPQEVLDLVART